MQQPAFLRGSEEWWRELYWGQLVSMEEEKEKSRSRSRSATCKDPSKIPLLSTSREILAKLLVEELYG